MDPHRTVEWQPDEAVSECPFCHIKFTFFYRRHHCRRCGRVVCGPCSSTRMAYTGGEQPLVAPNHLFVEADDGLHRTCDLCVEELILSSSDNPVNPSGSSADLNSLPMRVPLTRFIKDDTTQTSRLLVPEQNDEENSCPVCGESLSSKSQQAREEHVNACLIKAEFSGSPEQKRTSNRMLVYDIPYPENQPLIVSCSESTLPEIGSPNNNEKKPTVYDECLICLEEMRPGDKVGRLECFCVFHYKCIKSWFKRKGPGNCPVHALQL